MNTTGSVQSRLAAAAGGLLATALMLGGAVLNAQQPAIPPGSLTQNFEVVGYSDLGNQPAFKITINQVNGRWYLYLGHYVYRGWTVLDVTDPKKPTVANFIKGPDNTQFLGVEYADNRVIASMAKIKKGDESVPGEPRTDDPTKPAQTGIMIFDTSKDPVHWTKLGQFDTGGGGTHKNFYPGGRYVYLAANPEGYEGNIFMAVDISDPAHPVEVSRWWMPGQKLNAGEPPVDPGSSLHGPAIVMDKLAYLPYEGAGLVILDVSDIRQPKLKGRLDFSPPFRQSGALHSVLPVPEKKYVIVNSENVVEDCGQGADHVSIVDVADPAKPYLISVLPVPVPPAGLPYTDWCEKGGRFGPHNVSDHIFNPFVQKQGDILFVTYFNAGLRAFDISNPRTPKEVGSFVPPTPRKRYHQMPEDGKLVSQTEDVVVDTRGYIYVTDKNQGLFILRYTGPTGTARATTAQ